MTNPAETFAREALAAWEKAAAPFAESVVRDPRTLELGAGMLSASLMWKKAFDEAAQQAWSQWIALASQAPR
jgi:hypothetical protein